jgi:phosphoribosyl-ATP pyrophosphohydrolase
MSDVLARLQATISARRNVSPDSSYVSRLFHKGEDACLKKVAEETAEFIMAAKDNDKEHLVKEAADICFHLLVTLNYYGVGLAEVEAELTRREGTSGLVEKARRSSSD